MSSRGWGRRVPSGPAWPRTGQHAEQAASLSGRGEGADGVVAPMALTDAYGRRLDYLRVSVTDRCNLRCVYCMPPEGVEPTSHAEVLRYEEIELFVRVAVAEGVRHVRLTGGEPLVRRGFPALVAMLAQAPGLDDLAMTTNGQLLAEWAAPLKAAGLRRVNISLDTLRPDRYAELTRGGELARVWDGLAAAEAAGLHPIKMNVVVLRGVNADEIAAFGRLAQRRALHVRFLEFMPIGDGVRWERADCVPGAETRRELEALGELRPLGRPPGATSETFTWPGAKGTVGLISPLSACFCGDCSRLRLSADGKLRPCLLSDSSVDARGALRGPDPERAVREALREAAAAKPEAHGTHEPAYAGPTSRMSTIGG